MMKKIVSINPRYVTSIEWYAKDDECRVVLLNKMSVYVSEEIANILEHRIGMVTEGEE